MLIWIMVHVGQWRGNTILFYPWEEHIGNWNFELFDFEISREQIRPSTFRGQLRSKICLLFDIIISYLTSIDTSYLEVSRDVRHQNLLLRLSLYLILFSRYSSSKFLGFNLDLWPLEVIWGQNLKKIRKAIYDFLFDFYGHHLSISYRFRDIRLRSF